MPGVKACPGGMGVYSNRESLFFHLSQKAYISTENNAYISIKECNFPTYSKILKFPPGSPYCSLICVHEYCRIYTHASMPGGGEGGGLFEGYYTVISFVIVI